ncbi:hypothetical protein C8J57DRAFT_1373767, partial [Mycena rebaudengoi]
MKHKKTARSSSVILKPGFSSSSSSSSSSSITASLTFSLPTLLFTSKTGEGNSPAPFESASNLTCILTATTAQPSAHHPFNSSSSSITLPNAPLSGMFRLLVRCAGAAGPTTVPLRVLLGATGAGLVKSDARMVPRRSRPFGLASVTISRPEGESSERVRVLSKRDFGAGRWVNPRKIYSRGKIGTQIQSIEHVLQVVAVGGVLAATQDRIFDLFSAGNESSQARPETKRKFIVHVDVLGRRLGICAFLRRVVPFLRNWRRDDT